MSSYRGLHARSNGVENISNGGSVRSNWQWCGMGKRQRLKSAKFRVEERETQDPPLKTKGGAPGTRQRRLRFGDGVRRAKKILPICSWVTRPYASGVRGPICT
jgi:hypothetical protein